MRVVLHGVRGSSAAPGADFVRVGGNTSCLAITPDGCDAPTLLLDAGTGLSSVDRTLGDRPFRGEILLTHLHWDHVQGLPFFRAGDRDDAEVTVRMPAQCGAAAGSHEDAVALLGRAMSPPHFPIGPDGLRGRWTFDLIDAGELTAGGCRVTALEVPHKGGRTFGYRVEADGVSLAYIPDHDPSTDPTAGLLLAKGVDVLCHGAMFSDSERGVARAYGHATLGDVHRLAGEAGVGTLVLVHHAPTRTDDRVFALAAELPDGDPAVVVGCEGDVVLDRVSEPVES